MADSKHVKVLGVGSAILDLLFRVDDSFLKQHVEGDKGGMVLMDSESLAALVRKAESNGHGERVCGGSAANTICGLTHLGVKTAMLGKVGADDEGELYKKSYAAIGGDVCSFKLNREKKTGQCLSLITPDSERTMRTDLGAAATLLPEELSAADFNGITHVHIEGYLLFNMPFFMQTVKMAKQAGCTISLDLASFEVVKLFRKDLNAILEQYIDLVFANEDEAREFDGKADFQPETALEDLAKLCQSAVVKLGKKGALIRTNGINTAVSAELVQAIDTTGAGDLWQTGFLYGYLAGMSPEVCGKMASITGAEVVQIIGAAIPEKRWTVIRDRFQQLESR